VLVPCWRSSKAVVWAGLDVQDAAVSGGGSGAAAAAAAVEWPGVLPCGPAAQQLAQGVYDSLHYFGVFDGHGGADAARHCAHRMHQVSGSSSGSMAAAVGQWQQ
jgi:hypothetical protein